MADKTSRTSKTTWFGVVLDSTDARALARFYAEVTGWTIFTNEADWVTLAPAADAGYNLAFATEPLYVPPVWPTKAGEPQMRAHLDLEVDDLEAAVTDAVRLGANLADFQPQETVRVMLDPAGHPFCFYVDN
ncbi:VOC family protein [Calidifontibacter terrae]